MSENTTNAQQAPEATGNGELIVDGAITADKISSAPTEEAPIEPKMFDEKYVKQLREESARYRIKYQEAQDQLSKAKSLDEFEKLQQELAEQGRQLTMMTVVNETGFPANLTKYLVGNTAEEIRASAEELMQTLKVASTPKDLDGGMSPGGASDIEFDPLKAAREMQKRARMGR